MGGWGVAWYYSQYWTKINRFISKAWVNFNNQNKNQTTAVFDFKKLFGRWKFKIIILDRSVTITELQR